MSARFCMQCGAKNPPDAAFCEYCGTSMKPTGSSAPLPSSPGPLRPPPYPAAPTSGMEPPPRRRSWVRVAALVIVLLVVVGVIGALLFSGNDTVQVTEIDFSSPNDACGFNNTAAAGFNDTTGDTVELDVPVTGNNTTAGGTAACVIHTVSTPTAGFSISNATVPLVVPANATETLVFDLSLPNSSYDGNLTIVLT